MLQYLSFLLAFYGRPVLGLVQVRWPPPTAPFGIRCCCRRLGRPLSHTRYPFVPRRSLCAASLVSLGAMLWFQMRLNELEALVGAELDIDGRFMLNRMRH